MGLFFITLTITGTSLTHFPGDLGDARFNTYILEHAHKFLTAQTASLWNADFMYPEANAITYSDNLVGSAPIYSLFRLAGFDRETSFQCWFIMVAALNYLCCYFFLNWYFKNNYAAALGAMVFAFSMALQSQMTHAQTFPRFAVPLAFWMGTLFIQRLKPGYFFAAVFFVVGQLYCAIHLGFMLSVPVAALLVFSMLYRWELVREKIKTIQWPRLIAGSAMLNILLVLPLMLPYKQRAEQVGLNNYENIIYALPTVTSHFFSQQGSVFWDFLSKTGVDYPAWWDHQLFAGGTATCCLLMFVCIIIARIIRKKDFRHMPEHGSLLVLFYTGAATFILFTRINDFSFYHFLFNAPGFASMRGLQRIINVGLIFFAIAAACIFSQLLQKKNMRSALLFMLFAGIFTIDNYCAQGASYRTEKTVGQERVNRLLEKMKHIPPGSIVSYEPEKIRTNPIYYQLDAMLAAQTLGLKAVNGYSATCPYGYSPYWLEMNKQTREDWFRVKKNPPDRIYVVH